MEVHWELAQELRRRLLEPVDGRIGCVEGIPNAHTECSAVAERCNTELDRPECFIRLSCESLLDIEHPQLLDLRKLCRAAHDSEEFFFFANATDQWLRTVVGHEVLQPKIWIEAKPLKEVIPGIIIHSNVLPYEPYWSKLRATGNEANMTVHFPSRMLDEALNDRKTLKKTLQEWRDTGKELCDIGNHEPGQCLDGNCDHPNLTSKLFNEIQVTDVQCVRVLHKYGDDALIRLITWRGGQFIQKIFKDSQSFDMELEVLKRFSHPHLIYSFGKLYRERERSYFMEYMSNDLYKFIMEMNRVHGDKTPPFVADATVDILLQVAKAMRHMHQENVNVVHCDLKSPNILISEIATADAVKHYLVKVADFGSARFGGSRSGPAGNFIPGNGTTTYSAPEVLRQLKDKTLHIDYPHKIDVYSFGIVASEVLTGIINDRVYRVSPSTFKDGVIKGTQRPPLRAECKKHKVFIQDQKLLSLIERCWHRNPSQRPSFVEICKELDKVRERRLQTDPPRRQNSIMTSLQQGFSNFSFSRRKRL